ncbi:MAG: EAL domain-containing protein [Labilithrix sp.]
MSTNAATVRRIIVIDDNRAIHADFAKTLAANRTSETLMSDIAADLFDEPAEVVPASSTMTFELAFADQGQQGAEMVRAAIAAEKPFSVAFVDMRMPPGWDGVQTIKALWELDPELQCVICTAYSDYSWEDILRELGVNDRLLLLRKPFDSAEVCQLACALSEKWHLARHAHLKLEQLRSMVEEQTRQLAESEARYALASTSANDGLWEWNLETNEAFFAPRWSSLLGLPSRDATIATMDRWYELVHPDDAGALRAVFGQLGTGAVEQISLEYRARHADGHYRWMLCRGALRRSPSGVPLRAAGSQSDITNRKVAEAQLRHAADHDALTGLPNRAWITRRLEKSVARQEQAKADPHGFGFAVMFIDLDRFKVINDSLGHAVGDLLLREVAERLLASVSTVGPNDSFEGHVARLGGDEFIVVLEGIASEADAVRVAERILETVSRPVEADGNVIHPGLSVGIRVCREVVASVPDILRDADTALYRAKGTGRGRYHVFTDALHEAAIERWRIDNELRTAIEDNQFELFYQPAISLTTGKMQHVEALIRWRHPTRGLVGPQEFISLAEENGLIVPIGSWVLREACRRARIWRDRGIDLPIALNVASKQFAQPGFLEEVRSAIAAAGIPASAIRLELTESATMDPRAVETCRQMAEIGVDIYLDDFGTGYSSLSYLTRMPIKALKVDRSFVSRIVEDPMSAAIVKTVLHLASSLRMEVIAEGVETEAELALLQNLGCSYAQGFFWSKPVDAEAASRLATSSELSGQSLVRLDLRPSRAPRAGSIRPSRAPASLHAPS